jgi:hypothetical protein
MTFSRGAALDDLQRRYGGLLREREIEFDAGLAPLAAIPRDNERMVLTLVNLSANVIYVSPSPEVGPLRCIRLAGNGGLMSVNTQEDGLLPCLEWWSLATGAGSRLYGLAVRRDVALTSAGGVE